MVVKPPFAAAFVPVLEFSGGRIVWMCPSSIPGRTTFPPASRTTSAFGRFGSFARATMMPPSTAIPPSRMPLGETSLAFFTTRSTVILSRLFIMSSCT
jgi:hypothetical protein